MGVGKDNIVEDQVVGEEENYPEGGNPYSEREIWHMFSYVSMYNRYKSG